MKAERWRRVEELFLQCADLSPSETPRLLDESCGDDHDLRRQVEVMLAPAALGENWIEQAVAEAFVESPELQRKVPRRLGPYHLLEEIGRGGSSTVHLAERVDRQFEQQVAVKLIRRGLEGEDTLRRLRLERQILADFKHPNISRLLDGGATEDGIPYVVMEHIEGQPIDAYVEAHELPLRPRLELFRQICDAVHYAHQNLVIHRDIKPGNILVSADGSPKLLDFGIAKLLQEPRSGSATATGQWWLTPDFASPEQIRGEPLTTATDIYSLGVLLYLLMTGQPPYRLSERTPRELEEAICRVEPTRPSVAAGRREAPPSGLGTSSAKLRQRLAGDLDTIVSKAMHKDARRRYASVEQLSGDILRHLRRLPVLARPPTFTYRSGRFVRRHRGAVAAASLVLLSLLGTVALTSRQARIADEERERAQTALDFLDDMFEVADPGAGLGREISALALLDRGRANVEAHFHDQPGTRSALMSRLGTLYQRLGEHRQAGELFGKALEQWWLEGPGGEERTAELLNDLGEAAFRQGFFDQAEVHFEQALQVSREHFGEAHVGTAQSLINLGLLYRERGRLEEAEELMSLAVALQRQLSETDLERFLGWENLGILFYEQGRLEQAEELFRRALEGRLGTQGMEHYQVAGSRTLLAAALQQGGKLEEAASHYEAALEVQRAALGSDNAQFAVTLNNLGSLRMRQGRYNAAEAMLREALAASRAALGEEHPQVASGLDLLGELLRQRRAPGDWEEAETLFQEALERRHGTPDHPAAADPLISLARLRLDQQRPEEAEPLLREALTLLLASETANPGRIRTVETLLAACQER